jgi:hypothetical protein
LIESAAALHYLPWQAGIGDFLRPGLAAGFGLTTPVAISGNLSAIRKWRDAQ